MRMRTFLLAALLLGCSSESSETTPTPSFDATTDSAITDTSMMPPDTAPTPDTAKPDTATTPDTAKADTARPDVAAGGCTSAADCKKFSSYCDSCKCLPLKSTDPPPKCEGSMVTCFVDPCDGKTADCVGGSCVIK